MLTERNDFFKDCILINVLSKVLIYCPATN